MKNTAIVLAGGSGSRMNSAVKKQYLRLGTYPVLWYSLHAMQLCPRVDEVVLVCEKGGEAYCRRELTEKYGFDKVSKITEGGKERWNSVYEGLKGISGCRYVLIHDGARPFIGQDLLNRIFETLLLCPACVAGMPQKDTIKQSDADGFILRTIPRENLWMIQTPQAFSYPLIRSAYDKIAKQEVPAGQLTDDAMVLEAVSDVRVRLVEGSYENIKITTQEDLALAEILAPRYV